MLIDFHTHTQPSVEAARAFFALVKADRPPHRGDPEDLFARMAEVGVSRTLIVPWLPAQDMVGELLEAGHARLAAVRQVLEQWRGLNAWAAEAAARHPDRLSSLVGLDPILMSPAEVEAEVELRLAQGACGLKIAPKFLGVPPSDPRMAVVFDLAARYGVFVLSESGAAPGFGHEPWGHPEYFGEVLERWPTVRIMLAHLGRGAEDVVARLARRHPNLYTDLSFRLSDLDQPGAWTSAQLVDAVRAIGAGQVVYGTNYPLVDVAAYARAFQALDLTPEERELIGWRNAQALLVRTSA